MSCPFHGFFRRNCSQMCHNQHQRGTLTEQEAEQELMLLALTVSNSVLDESDEFQRQEHLQILRQQELDMELALALANFDRIERRMGNTRRQSSRHRQAQQEIPWSSVSIRQGNRVSNGQGNARALPSVAEPATPSNGVFVTTTPVNLQLYVGVTVNRPSRQSPPPLHSQPPPPPRPDIRPDSPYYGLHPMYHNYRYVPVKFSEEHQWPTAAVYKQLEELKIPRGNEDIVLWQEGMSENDRCLICLTNVATRIAVPCGHKLSCRECIRRVTVASKSNKRYLALLPNGQYLPTRYEIPVRCLLCRCIVGMVVVCH